MFDLLAHATTEPQSLLAFAVLAFAAGMFPVGLMLGGTCSACCKQRNSELCSACENSDYPDFVTATIAGMPDQTPGEYACPITFDACFGDLATGQITSPGGTEEPGPVTGYMLTGGGFGYAKLGREEPTVTASLLSGDAELEVTLLQQQDECGVDYWIVSKVEATKAGTTTPNGSTVIFSTAEGDTAEVGAEATVETEYSPPTVTLSVPGGNGANLSPNWTPIGDPPTAWALESITVNYGGAGYARDTEVTITPTGQTQVETPALARIDTGPDEPSVTLSVSSGTGSGAVIQAVFGAAYIVDVTVVDGGTGYEEADFISVTPGANTTETTPAAFAITVDEDGVITSVTVTNIGEYHYEDGTIDSVNVIIPGSYFIPAGPITNINLAVQGKYFRENPELEPYVSEPIGTTACGYPGSGSGATFSATVDTNTASISFGQITAIQLQNAGSNYYAYAMMNSVCCGSFWNGSWVLERVGCQYEHRACAPNGWKRGGRIIVALGQSIGNLRGMPVDAKAVITRLEDGADTSPDLPGICATRFMTSGQEYEGPCDPSMTFVANSVDFEGATLSVTPGGEYDPQRNNIGKIGQYGYEEPDLTATVSGGSGAQLSIKYNEVINNKWAVESIEVEAGGTGYTNGASVEFGNFYDVALPWLELPLNISDAHASATISTDDEGVITGVTIVNGGRFYKYLGPLWDDWSDSLPRYANFDACNICCKGVEEIPQELTISLTGLNAYCQLLGAPDYDGDYVLRHSEDTEEDGGVFGDVASAPAFVTEWNFFISNENLASQIPASDVLSIQVRVRPCSVLNEATGFVPRTIGLRRDGFGVEGHSTTCDECHNKCHVDVRVKVFHAPLEIEFQESWKMCADPGDMCGEQCIDSPVCKTDKSGSLGILPAVIVETFADLPDPLPDFTLIPAVFPTWYVKDECKSYKYVIGNEPGQRWVEGPGLVDFEISE